MIIMIIYIHNLIRKKKIYNRYNNNFYKNNNEEIMSKSVNEIKNKTELMRVRINIKENKFKELIVYKDQDIYALVKQFCSDNYINENLIKPLCNKINQSLIKLNLVTNNILLNREDVVMLEKAKNLIQHK